ncbi:helix-turn-helix transcriptional regulator [Sinorhizobium psoraleae]|uniref:helix-turn-helix transcriptional regulator n=1 Tax=Sinorhizobium psoraleae TaxID=520838 RepID=UPI00249D99FE|nr:AlpA family phage regulatory protein [Sinorhizobium psoraleae]
MNEACRMTSLSRTAINAKRAAGTFPKAVSLGGPKRFAFVASEVAEWIDARITGRAAA